MADRADQLQETSDYRAQTVERARVALVAGSGSAASDDLYRLLHRRLLVLTSILAVGLNIALPIALGIHLTNPPPPGSPAHGLNPADWMLANWRASLNLVVSCAAAVMLWRWPPRTVRGLRLIEVAVIGTFTVNALTIMVNPVSWARLERAVAEPFDFREALIGRYIGSVSLTWYVNITI